MAEYAPLFAVYFHWDPRVIEQLTLTEFDILGAQAERLHQEATRRS